MIKEVFPQSLELTTDEMPIDDESDSEEDDFADVKDKSTLCEMHTNTERKKSSKDSTSFATAMSAILSSSLKAHTRSDPILARSKSHSRSLETAKTEYRQRKVVAAARKALRGVGHVEDLSTYDAKELEFERMLKKTAQRGVIKLFNAVRGAQIKAEAAQSQTTGSRAERQEKAKEMSRDGFLNLIKKG